MPDGTQRSMEHKTRTIIDDIFKMKKEKEIQKLIQRAKDWQKKMEHDEEYADSKYSIMDAMEITEDIADL